MKTAALASLARLTVTACASSQSASDASSGVNDPFEGVNRNIYAFNEAVDKAAIEPVARGYRAVVPEPGREGVHNVLTNLRQPIVFTNSVLQGNANASGETLSRFLINSTIGVAGIFDVASTLGIEEHDEDFGQTLGVWGAGSGAYIVLPVLGPSNVRDTVGMVADAVAFSFVMPNHIQDETAYSIVQYGLKPVNTRANNDFRYHETGSPFEYELVRYVTTEGRRLAVME